MDRAAVVMNVVRKNVRVMSVTQIRKEMMIQSKSRFEVEFGF